MISNEATKEELAEEIIKLKSQNKHLSTENNYYKNIIKEVREYIETLRNYRFNVDLGENREQLEIVGSTKNFVKDILEILDKGE